MLTNRRHRRARRDRFWILWLLKCARREALFFIILCVLWASGIHAQGAVREQGIDNTIFHLAVPLLAETARADTSVDLSHYFPPVGHQQFEDCVGWAVGYYYKTFQEAKLRDWSPTLSSHQFSPQFLYNQTNGGVDQGSGMSCAYRALLQIGCSPLTTCPLTNDYTSWPSASAYLEAMKYRVADLFYLPQQYSDEGVNALRALLLAGEAATFSIALYDNFRILSLGNADYCIAGLSGGYYTDHAVTVIGFDDYRTTADGTGAFRCINSWGTSWGDGGYFWISYQLFKYSQVYHSPIYYAQPRQDYVPVWILWANLEHQYSGNAGVRVWLGDTVSPSIIRKWNEGLIYFSPVLAERPFPPYDIPIDITEFASAFSAGAHPVTFRIWDYYSDGADGTVHSACVRHASGGTAFCAPDVPQQAPDLGGLMVPLVVDTTPVRPVNWSTIKSLYR